MKMLLLKNTSPAMQASGYLRVFSSALKGRERTTFDVFKELTAEAAGNVTQFKQRKIHPEETR